MVRVAKKNPTVYSRELSVLKTYYSLLMAQKVILIQNLNIYIYIYHTIIAYNFQNKSCARKLHIGIMYILSI